MSEYFIGGWTEELTAAVPSQFSYVMFGMVTNLTGLTTGTAQDPGWSPASTAPPQANALVLWTYGGGGCSPTSMPSSSSGVTQILDATSGEGWAGVDFDDECSMDIELVIQAMTSLSQTSYTFLAGWDYNNPDQSSEGQAINDSVSAVASSGECDRFVLMAYGSAMWSQQDIIENVGPAITRTIGYVGDSQKVVLALTPEGLDSWNLNYFLNQVTENQLGGLFIWDFTALSSEDLNTICTALGIDSNMLA